MTNACIVHHEIASPRTRAALVATATHLLGNAADAEDCVQEALLLAARNAHAFEARACARTWLTRVVRNACLMHRRASRRLRRGGAAVHITLDDLPIASIGDPEQEVISRALVAVIEDELQRVSHRDADVFLRCVVDERALADVAEERRMSRQALKSRLYRVRRRLADRLSGA
jgi:RNA polymerase sigma-70 factor (ECF subfamily)